MFLLNWLPEKSLNQVGQGTFLLAAPIPSSRLPRPSILLLSCTVRLYLKKYGWCFVHKNHTTIQFHLREVA